MVRGIKCRKSFVGISTVIPILGRGGLYRWFAERDITGQAYNDVALWPDGVFGDDYVPYLTISDAKIYHSNELNQEVFMRKRTGTLQIREDLFLHVTLPV